MASCHSLLPLASEYLAPPPPGNWQLGGWPESSRVSKKVILQDVYTHDTPPTMPRTRPLRERGAGICMFLPFGNPILFFPLSFCNCDQADSISLNFRHRLDHRTRGCLPVVRSEGHRAKRHMGISSSHFQQRKHIVGESPGRLIPTIRGWSHRPAHRQHTTQQHTPGPASPKV